MNMVSRGILSIIGISCISGIILFIIIQVEMDNQKMVWVQRVERNHNDLHTEFLSWFTVQIETNKTHVTSDSYDPIIDYLKTKNVVVYDSKTEFKQELVTLCEGYGCTTGDIHFYLISKKDMPELAKLGFG